MNDETPQESVAVILARMEVKLDHSLTKVDDHEARLRILEKKVWGAAGSAAVLAAIAVSVLNNMMPLGG